MQDVHSCNFWVSLHLLRTTSCGRVFTPRKSKKMAVLWKTRSRLAATTECDELADRRSIGTLLSTNPDAHNTRCTGKERVKKEKKKPRGASEHMTPKTLYHLHTLEIHSYEPTKRTAGLCAARCAVKKSIGSIFQIKSARVDQCTIIRG